ncbi:Ig-like domain-containing protein [Cellulomonas sp. Y8]|uniref:Ig-like domain-containing protein n=1 Tax=Cellulomonas sp. Y8 TaxID=2591145 RepID=UPI0011C8021E|nr:Ig-like domain-containing protein [Cellulomonas sp. Y8]
MRRTPAAVTLALALVAAPVLAASPAAAAPPTATIRVETTRLKAGDTSVVTFTFSEPVEGFDRDDLAVSRGTLSVPTTSDGQVFTAVLTPQDGVTSSGVVVLDNAGVTDTQGTPGSGTTTSNTFDVDTARPTATVSVSQSSFRSGTTGTVTLTFSEAVIDVTTAALTVDAGTVSWLASTDGGLTWTATLTPAGDTEMFGAVVTLNLALVHDAAGNTGQGTASSAAYAVDTRRPTATVGLSTTTLGIDGSATLTTVFSEPVLGFDLGDVTVRGGTVGALTTADNITWTATFVPAAGTNVSGQVVTVDLAGVMDQAGNVGSGTVDSPAYTVDSVRPVGTVSADRAVVRAGETATVTMTFSEPVRGAGGAGPGLSLVAGGGTLTAPTSSDGGLTWTATFTPDAAARTTADLVLDLTTVVDVAGNAGTGSAVGPSLTVRTTRPTATVSVSEPVLTTTTDAVLTLTFSEPVSVGLWRALSTPGASVPVLTSSDGGVTWTGRLTGAAGTESGPAAVTLDLAQLVSDDGDAGVGTATSGAYTVDTVRPTATLALAATRVTGPTTLTITFSEPVPTLALTDLVADAGTLSGLATADGGLTWTATYTPDAGARVGAATIRLALAGVTDLAGNAGVAAALSVPFAVEAPAAPGTPVPAVPLPGAPVVPGVPAAVPPAGTAVTAPVVAAPARTLPRTGSEAGAALAVAAGLLLAGAAAVGARGLARSRRGRA